MNENALFYLEALKDLAPLIISLIAIWLTTRYQKHTKKLADDRMMKDLFTEFNQRYDKINNKLDVISKMTEQEWNKLSEKERAVKAGTVIDFFNISAEEYFWHKEGRIKGNIWASWSKGMNDIFNKSKVIQTLWAEECKNEGYKSYYIADKNEIFKNV